MQEHGVPEKGGAGPPGEEGTPSPASRRAEEMNLSSWHRRKSRSSSRSSMRFCSQEFLSRARCSWARTLFIRAAVGEAASDGSRGGRPWSHPRPQGPWLNPHGTQSPSSPLTLEVPPRGAQAVKDLRVQVGRLIEGDGNLQGLAVLLHWPPPAVHGAAFCRPRQLSASGPLDKKGSHRWRNTDGLLGGIPGDLGLSTWGGLFEGRDSWV